MQHPMFIYLFHYIHWYRIPPIILIQHKRDHIKHIPQLLLYYPYALLSIQSIRTLPCECLYSLIYLLIDLLLQDCC